MSLGSARVRFSASSPWGRRSRGDGGHEAQVRQAVRLQLRRVAAAKSDRVNVMVSVEAK